MVEQETREQGEAPVWLEQVRRQVRRWCASDAGTRWVVAVSGGGDSVALLHALHRLAPEFGLTLLVAHLDHGTRGGAARADAAFVRDLAVALGLPVELGQWRPTRASHFETDARRARYAWLVQVAAARGATAVAVGHTRDDQAETILHRIVRGTGLRGLAGMPAHRILSRDPSITLVRPLLSVSRQTLRQSLESAGHAFREDVSNADQARTRARIRHDLLPLLAREYNPRVAAAIVRLGTLAGASERILQRQVTELANDATSSLSRDQIVLRRDRLREAPYFLRAEILRQVWRLAGWPEAGMSASRWQRLARLACRRRNGRTAIGGGIELLTDDGIDSSADHLVLRRIEKDHAACCRPDSMDHFPMEVPGSVPWVNGKITTFLDPTTPRDETMDLDRIMPPLFVRAPVPGDRFEPLGMGGKGTPLNDFFRGRNIDVEERARTPLLCDAAGIIWVVGHRIADRVRLTDQTRRTLGLRWQVGL